MLQLQNMAAEPKSLIQGPLGKVPEPISNKEPRPWQVLSSLPFQTLDQKAWWDKFGAITQTHLERANYGVGAQYRYLLMLYSLIFPVLGPLPNKSRSNLTWPSFMNENDPCEISVNYQKGSSPCVRIAVDPSGPLAGTIEDPLNDEAPMKLLKDLQSMQSDVDLELFDHLNENMCLSNKEARVHWESVQKEDVKSQRILALDLHEHSFAVKSYCVPLLRSLTGGVDPLRLTFDSIKSICDDKNVLSGLSMVEEYLYVPENLAMDFNTYLSFDCLKMEQSRFKVYAAVNEKSLADSYDSWTLGGRLKGYDIEEGFKLVAKIWEVAFASPLPSGKPRESLLVHWNWELSPKSPEPTPKAYFRFWNEYDSAVTDAITCLFEDLGWTEHLATYHKIQNES